MGVMMADQQTVPTAPPQTMPPDQANQTSTIHSTTGISSRSDAYRAGFVRLGSPVSQAQPPAPVNKYHSIHSLQQSDKVEALKNTKLNPNLIEDGYDQLAHGYHLWTVVGAKAQKAGNISFDEQKQIASNFYDQVIAPAYGHIYKDSGGAEPLSKDLWMRQAYS